MLKSIKKQYGYSHEDDILEKPLKSRLHSHKKTTFAKLFTVFITEPTYIMSGTNKQTRAAILKSIVQRGPPSIIGFLLFYLWISGGSKRTKYFISIAATNKRFSRLY